MCPAHETDTASCCCCVCVLVNIAQRRPGQHLDQDVFVWFFSFIAVSWFALPNFFFFCFCVWQRQELGTFHISRLFVIIGILIFERLCCILHVLRSVDVNTVLTCFGLAERYLSSIFLALHCAVSHCTILALHLHCMTWCSCLCVT